MAKRGDGLIRRRISQPPTVLMGSYPEHEKLAARKEEHQNICEFLEYCQNKEMFLAKYKASDKLYGDVETFDPDKIIAEFFGINRRAFNDEKRKMLADFAGGNDDN